MTNAGFASAVGTSVGKSIIRHVIVIAVLLLIPVAQAPANDQPTDAQCRNFADFAVRNAQKVRALNCTTLPWNDPSLSLNNAHHYRWCRMMRTETVEKQMEVLVAQSDKCEYCRSLANAVDDVNSEYNKFVNETIAEDNQFRRKSTFAGCAVANPFGPPSGLHARCMAYEEVIGGRHYYDADRTRAHFDALLGQMALGLTQCVAAERRRRSQGSHESTRAFPAVPQCPVCHQRSGVAVAAPASLQLPPKRVSTDPTIARQPPAFTPVPERRRTPRDTDRSTSSGSDQATRGGEPCGTRANPCKPASGGSSSAMDRLGGGGTSGVPLSGGGSAPRSPGVSGGAASGGSPAGGSTPNVNSNTIMRQAPAFGTSPGLR